LARPEPGPVGVKVEPLGEPLGESVLPEGFTLLLGPVVVLRLAEPVVPAVGLAPMDEPVAAPLVVEPPPETPPADPPPLVCAIAKVLVSASAPANAIVVSFMAFSFVDGGIITTTGLCSGRMDHGSITFRPMGESMF
jgi:hypothetical protein